MARLSVDGRLTVTGASGLAARFYAADVLVQKRAQRVTREYGGRVLRLARVYCPVDTGFMREHIRETYTADGLAVTVGWDAEEFFAAGLEFYPPFQEFGTSQHPAQPSLLPAANLAFPKYEADMRRVLQDGAARMRRAA